MSLSDFQKEAAPILQRHMNNSGIKWMKAELLLEKSEELETWHEAQESLPGQYAEAVFENFIENEEYYFDEYGDLAVDPE